MFARLFSFNKTRIATRDVPHEIYGSLVSSARNPVLYRDLNVPDTMNGRFDMMVIHVFILAHRLKDADKKCQALSQAIFDAFLLDMDRGMREEGVGDISIPKKLKKMTQIYYGRLRAYEKPLEEGDRPALAEIINRNIFTDAHEDKSAALIANYMLDLHAHLKTLPDQEILQGTLAIEYIEPKTSA